MSPPVSLPSKEMLRMVITIADMKASMPRRLRDVINKEYGVIVQVSKLPGGVHYTAGGKKVMPDLRFVLKRDGKALRLESYTPGDWELELKRAYDDLVTQSGAFEGLSIKLPEPPSLTGEATRPPAETKPQLPVRLPQQARHTGQATRPPGERKPRMRIGMQTWGGHGDIRPLLALAEGLQSSGHEVSLAITCINSAEYNASISKTGVKIHSVASPVIRDKEEFAEIEKTILNEANSIKRNYIIMTRLYLPVEAEVYQVAEQLCVDNDLVIGQYWHYPLQTAAEKAGRDHVSVMLNPRLVPSSLQPPLGYPMLGKSQLGNRLAWVAVRSAHNKHVKTYVDRLRAAHGLKPAKDMISDVFSSHQLTLIAVSPQICQPQKDWPHFYQVCGFLDMPNLSIEGDVSESLEEFLSHGDPPVYMTFGSSMPSDIPTQRETVGLLSEAAAIANCRAIIQAPLWQEFGLKPTQAVHYVHASPYGRVFPRCRAIIHHGGSGTTQAATLAGKPSIVVAFGADQEVWGRELERIGIAPRLLSARKATAEALAKSIKKVISSGSMDETAKRIGAAMNRENGVGMAVKLINERFNI